MKITDLKREHFPNGQTFSQKALEQYLAARVRAFRDFFTRYVLSLLGGIAVGFIVSLFMENAGMFRYLIPMLCVMVGALVGTRLTSKSLENFRDQAQRIRMTKRDIRAAKKHLRNGTVAWSSQKLTDK